MATVTGNAASPGGASSVPSTTVVVGVPQGRPTPDDTADASTAGPMAAGLFIVAAVALAAIQSRRKTLRR